MVSAHRMLATFVVFSIFVTCLGQGASLTMEQEVDASPNSAITTEQEMHASPITTMTTTTSAEDASCTTDIARDGTRCRCDSPCDYHGGSYNLWCRIDNEGGERYCCKKKCILNVRQSALTPASQLLYKCAAGTGWWGILVECNIDRNTLNPHGK